MPLSKEQEKRTISMRWVKENQKAIMLTAKLQREGFDVEGYLRDYLKGEAKDPEHYWIERG